jgi:hypothetical protein
MPAAVDEVAQVDQAAREAAAEVELLEDRVRAGDEHVTAEQVEKARGLARFAELRREAARRRAERRLAEARRAEAERVLAELAETGPDSVRASQAAVIDALASAREALGRLADAVTEHGPRVRETAARLAPLQDVLPEAASAAGVVLPVVASASVQVAGWSAAEVSVLDAVCAAISPTLEAHNVYAGTPNGPLIQRHFVATIAKRFHP